MPLCAGVFLREHGRSDVREKSEEFSARRLRQNRRSRRDALAHLDRGHPLRPEDDINPGSEFYVADSLTCAHDISRLFVTYDAPRDQTCNMAANNAAAWPFHYQRILLILQRSLFMACHEKLALPIQHFRDSPGNGRAIYVNIEDIQEYADPGFCRGELLDRDDFAVGGGHDRVSTWRSTLRIAEEIQTKRRNDVERNPQPWMDEVPQGQSKGDGPRRVVKTIRNDAQDFILSWLYRLSD
jgi:hypothetical protein